MSEKIDNVETTQTTKATSTTTPKSGWEATKETLKMVGQFIAHPIKYTKAAYNFLNSLGVVTRFLWLAGITSPIL